MSDCVESELFPAPRRDKAAIAFLAAVGLALAVTAGVLFSAAATGAVQDLMHAVGFGRTDAIAAEQRRQTAEVIRVRQTVGDLKGAVARLERSHPNLTRELIRLQGRVEKSGQTELAIINRIGTLAADLAALKAEMNAVRSAASEAASHTEAAVAERFAKLDSEMTTLRREVTAVSLDVGETGVDAAWRAHVDDLNASLARSGIEIGALRSTLDSREQAYRSELEAQRTNIVAIAQRIDRLEHIAAARDATGSIRPKASRRHEQRTLSGWSVNTAGSDSAVITGQSGTYEVKPGTVVPGLGRIAELRQRGSRWLVVTDKGVIAQR
jgi:septal ring factor EnvC (AmiA/AmiB activator)